MKALQDTRSPVLAVSGAHRSQGISWKPILRRLGFQPVADSPVAPESEKHLSLARLAGAAGLVILAAYLLFAHGCHGDEDNELFSVVRRVTQSTP
jgi:hypothetical protein